MDTDQRSAFSGLTRKHRNAQRTQLPVTRADGAAGWLGRRWVIRATQWSLMTMWPAGGQRRARSNALVGTRDDGYADPGQPS